MTKKQFTKAPIFFILLFSYTCLLLSCKDDTPVPPPQVATISPVSGPKATMVTITGINFSAVVAENVVTFNGRPGITTSASATQLTVTVPIAAGTGPVVVTTNRKTSENKPEFTYEWQVSTLAGSSEGYADGSGSDAHFNGPGGLTTDNNGNIFITDYYNSRVRKVSSTGVVSTFAGSGVPGDADGKGISAQFVTPAGAARDEDGNIYIADELLCRIRKITSAGVVSTLAGSVNGFADGSGASARFYYPSGIAIDQAGNLYVVDQYNARIRKVSPLGAVETFAGSTTGYADGPGSTALFNRPVGVEVDRDGYVYVGDLFNHCIRKITPQGEVTTLAGGTPGNKDGKGEEAQFLFPTGLALDANNNIYVADSDNHLIRKITPEGVVTTFAGSVKGLENGNALSAKFSSPREIHIDKNGVMYIVETGNHLIRRID